MRKRAVNKRVQQLVVQPFKDRAKHQQLLLVPLSHLGRGHARVRGVGKHQEQICIERTTHALAAVLNVKQQMLKIQVDIKRSANGLRSAVNKGDATRQHFHIAVLHGNRNLKRRLGLVVDDLRLAKLLVLKLLDVSKCFHARAVTVNVAASGCPPGDKTRKVLETANAQELVLLSANLKIPRPERHVLAVALLDVAVGTRLNGVDNGNPLVQVATVVHVLDRVGAVVVTKLLHNLANGLFKFAVQGADAPLVIGGNAIFARSYGVMMHHVLKIRQHNAGCRAKAAQFFVHLVQGAVRVRPLKDYLHSLGDIIQPQLDGLIRVQLRISRRKAKPRASGRGRSGHHASPKRPQGPRTRVVVNVVVTPPSLVAVLPEVTAVARKDVGGQFLIVRPPGGAFGLELTPAGEQLIPLGCARIRTSVTCVLAH